MNIYKLKTKHPCLSVKKGFTLLELLVVVAVIIILISAIIISMSSARTKSQLAAFKSETRGSYNGLANLCTTTGNAFSNTPDDTKYTNWDGNWDVASNNRNCSSDGKFIIHATPMNTGIDCTATVTENGVTYTGPNCN